MSTNPRLPVPQRATESARVALTKLPSETRIAEVFAKACELATEAIGVERVGIWLYVDDRTALRCTNLYERSRREHSAGAILRVADFEVYFKSLSIRKAVPAELAVTDARTAELATAYMNPLGVTSMLDAGIFIDTVLVGVICHEHVGTPREWTTEERDFAGSMADLMALRIQSAEVADLREALRTKSARLVMIDKAEALEQMAAGLAHDFRNLLSVIVGNAEMLSDRDDLAASARPPLADILTAAQRGVGLANEMLNFAKPASQHPEVLNLADVASEFLPVLRAAVGSSHRVRYSPPALVGKVLADKGQFTQVLLNLTLNARDAMPSGGDITLRIAGVRLDSAAGSAGHYVMLEVTDQGIGMDHATRRRAFEPFFTTKAKGTGIGLAIVRRVADRVGGFVRIDSEPGKGSTLRVFYPRVGASSGGTTEFPVLPRE